MDPFSIAAGCASLLDVITKTFGSIYAFIGIVREAPKEVELVAKQLADLKFILDLIQRNVKPHEAALTITEDRRDTIFELFNNCREDIEHINSIICEHNGFKDSLLWAVTGRSKVQDLTRTLEGNIGRLKLIMGAITGCNIQMMVGELQNLNAQFGKTKECTMDILGDTTILKQQSVEQAHRIGLLAASVFKIESKLCGESNLSNDGSDDGSDGCEEGLYQDLWRAEDMCGQKSLSNEMAIWNRSDARTIIDTDCHKFKGFQQTAFSQILEFEAENQGGLLYICGSEPTSPSCFYAKKYSQNLVTSKVKRDEGMKEDKIRDEVKRQVWQVARLSSPSFASSSTLTQSPAMPLATSGVSKEEIQRRFKDQVQQQAKNIVPSNVPRVTSRRPEEVVVGKRKIVGENTARAVQYEFKRKVMAAASDMS